MSLRQRVRLEIEGRDPVEVEYSAVDLRAWERKHHVSALTADLSVEMLSWLGHHAATRQNLLNGSLSSWEAFDAVCTSVEGMRDEERPTKPPKAATRKKASEG